MRYYVLEQDKGYSDIPRFVDWFKHLTMGNKINPDINNICNRDIFMVNMEENSIFPDVMFSPFFIVTDKIKECITLYEPNMQFKEIILLNSKKRKVQNYFMPMLIEIECLTPNSEYTFGHHDLKYIELDEDKIGDKTIFQIKGVETKYVIARLDVVESLLRRGAKALMVREVDVFNKCRGA